jgi:hypothetical protein
MPTRLKITTYTVRASQEQGEQLVELDRVLFGQVGEPHADRFEAEPVRDPAPPPTP